MKKFFALMNRALKQVFSLSSVSKPLTDLLIVVTGVSLAFLLNSWNESKKEQAEQLKVMTSLQHELEDMRDLFPSLQEYQDKKIKEWDSIYAKGNVADFYNYRYLQPQYNYSVIEYAIGTRNSNIVGFELHEQLLELFNSIKMLEQSEIYMTELALQYQPVPEMLSSELTTQRNKFLFRRFIVFGSDRARSIGRVGKLATKTLDLLEKGFGPETKK